MAKAQRLGFESPLVLMKLGHDLRDTLADTTEAALPESLEARIADIPEEPHRPDVLQLSSDEFERLGDKPLF